jgi:prevent-host-death family protein
MMSGQVSIAEAKAKFASLIARAEAGETIIVTRNGRPVARLVPLAQARPIKYGDLRGIALADDLLLPEDVISDFEPAS